MSWCKASRQEIAEHIQQFRQQMQLILGQLDQAQSLRSKCIGNCLNSGGLTGSGIAVEQDIGSFVPGKQRSGILDDLISLQRIADQVGQCDGIRMDRRFQNIALFALV